MRILDTDTCIEILRGNRLVLDARRQCPEFVGTTWISLSELHYGAAKSPRPEHHRCMVERFARTLPVLPWKAQVAEQFGTLKAGMEKRGTRLADADLWTAAFALTSHATLVTGNLRHYERVSGLVLENWIEG